VALAPIAQEVHAFSKKLGLSSDLAIIEHAWELEVGRLREFARIAALDHASLVVEVDSHSVMQEISLRRKELVRKLNNHLPTPFLQQITVRISQYHGR
jgi:hypothetical protein